MVSVKKIIVILLTVATIIYTTVMWANADKENRKLQYKIDQQDYKIRQLEEINGILRVDIKKEREKSHII